MKCIDLAQLSNMNGGWLAVSCPPLAPTGRNPSMQGMAKFDGRC